MSRKKYLKMSTPGEVRKSINRITNMVLNNEIDPKIANSIIYGANIVLGSIRTDEYDKRIAELESYIESYIG